MIPDIFVQENKSDQFVEAKESLIGEELGNAVTCADKTLKKEVQVFSLILENDLYSNNIYFFRQCAASILDLFRLSGVCEEEIIDN